MSWCYHPPGLKGILSSGMSSGAKGASRGGLGAAAPSPLSHITPNTGFGAEEESPHAHPSPALPFTPCFSFAGSVPKARGEGQRGQPGHPGAAPEDGHCSWTQGPAAGHTDSRDSSSPWAVMERQGCEKLSLSAHHQHQLHARCSWALPGLLSPLPGRGAPPGAELLPHGTGRT